MLAPGQTVAQQSSFGDSNASQSQLSGHLQIPSTVSSGASSLGSQTAVEDPFLSLVSADISAAASSSLTQPANGFLTQPTEANSRDLLGFPISSSVPAGSRGLDCSSVQVAPSFQQQPPPTFARPATTFNNFQFGPAASQPQATFGQTSLVNQVVDLGTSFDNHQCGLAASQPQATFGQTSLGNPFDNHQGAPAASLPQATFGQPSLGNQVVLRQIGHSTLTVSYAGPLVLGKF